MSFWEASLVDSSVEGLSSSALACFISELELELSGLEF